MTRFLIFKIICGSNFSRFLGEKNTRKRKQIPNEIAIAIGLSVVKTIIKTHPVQFDSEVDLPVVYYYPYGVVEQLRKQF
jgi:hypothetical protein